jgi:hypothetical protein
MIVTRLWVNDTAQAGLSDGWGRYTGTSGLQDHGEQGEQKTETLIHQQRMRRARSGCSCRA